MADTVRAVFHWKYTSAMGVAFWFSGVGAMISDKFVLAIVFYLVGGVWLTGWRVVEYPFPKPFTKNRKAATRRRRIGVLLPIIVTAAFCYYTLNLRSEFTRTQYFGYLEPGDDPAQPVCAGRGSMSPADEELPDDVTAVYLGNNRFASQKFPYSPLTYDGKPVLTIERDEKGRVGLTLDIRDKDGKIVARLRKGKFTVNQNNILTMRRPNDSTLIVEDQYGSEVVNLHYWNRRVIQFLGTIYLEGRKTPVRISQVQMDTGGLQYAGTCQSYSPNFELIVPIPKLREDVH